MTSTVWLDAQLSPSLATWMRDELRVHAIAVRDLGLRDADDVSIFEAARTADSVVMTKDVDFVHLLHRFGPPPRVIWLTCGNTSNALLQGILQRAWPDIQACLADRQTLIEVRGASR